MSGTVSYTTYDFSKVHIVPVIASFDTEGRMLPLYVRINGESLKVHSAWLQSEFSKFVYRCQIIDQGILKPLVLTYHPHENVWTIPIFNS